MGLIYKGIIQHSMMTWHRIYDTTTGLSYEIAKPKIPHEITAPDGYSIECCIGGIWSNERKPEVRKKIIACAWPMVEEE